MADNQPTPTQNEQWRDVPDYEGLYQVSDHGRIRSVDRVVTRSDGQVRRLKGKVLCATLHPRGGYPYVSLSTQGKRRVCKVHALVAESFIGPRPEGMDVCHNDGDPTNSHVDNLRYGTRSENILDQVRHGTHNEAVKTHCPRGHELFAENIPPSVARRGHRQCRACHRARARVHYHSHLRDQFQAVADSYYQAILEERKTA